MKIGPKECAEVYQTLLNKRYRLTLENDAVLEFQFQRENFFHLLGLHKLTDIRILRNQSASKTFKDVLSGKISENVLVNSTHFHLVQDRFRYFYLLPALLSGKIVVDFDCRLILGGTSLQHTRYILYSRVGGGVLHLTIGEALIGFYPETFFFDTSNKYLSEQLLLEVKTLEVFDLNKK